ncbi:hypothetical protein EUX98_g8962 [Antrodiella citrinella]|uniref:Uncharacterized protein n=1 Tax=Antrodiella citrinella TaxID=2447956 RepID=A0A4S4M0A8_9APHY|nr:hypothetical protein EUX98_g8962 [Antrodiella citrinella]
MLESSQLEARIVEVVTALVVENEDEDKENHRPALAQDPVAVIPSPTILESDMMMTNMVRTVAAQIDERGNDDFDVIYSISTGIEELAKSQMRAAATVNGFSVGVVLPTPLEVAAAIQTIRVADSHYRGINSWTSVILGRAGSQCMDRTLGLKRMP